MSIDTKLAAAITAHGIAQKRGDTRSVHFWRERMRDLRTKQMRRDLGWRGKARRTWRAALDWLAPLARIAGTFGMALIAGAVWSIVDAPEAYATECATKFDGAIDPTTAAIAIGLTVAIVAILVLMSLLATNSRDDEPFNKPEDWGSQ